MKRVLTLLLSALLILNILPLLAFGAETTQSKNAAIAQKAAEIEKKYGINIRYPQDREGNAIITLNGLITMDDALANVTPTIVKQVSAYYKEKNGKKLTFSYVQHNTNLSINEAILAGFDDKTSLIELYIPTSSGSTIATGENPLSIVHEFSHALHLMCAAKYGAKKMQSEWKAFNEGEPYSADNIIENPNTKVFITGYAATMYEEDAAETIAHTFIRNRAGQGFSNRLTVNGKRTGLGKKVDYIEKMITANFTDTTQAVANFRKAHSTPTSTLYQGMKFSGEYLQFAGYPQPRFILNGTLNSLGKKRSDAIWIRPIGGWYVQEDNGSGIIVFPGGVWCDVNEDFVRPKSSNS